MGKTRGKPFELYVGDPSKCLKKVCCEALRFSDRNCVDEGEIIGLPGPGSVVWDGDSNRLYCRMIDEKQSHHGHFQYVIVKVNATATM